MDPKTPQRVISGNFRPQSGIGVGENRIRVLLSALTCDPYRGSEPGCGWGRVLETAKHFDVWVICGEGEPSIRRWLAEHGEIPSLHFHFLPPTRLEMRLARVPGMMYIAYNHWQRRAFRLAKALHDEFRFDVVHQVNLGTYREPGYLWKLDAPFVWGPVGGIENYPWRFLWKAGIAGALSEGTRSAGNYLQSRLSPRVREAARRAAAVFTVNSMGRDHFRRHFMVETIPMLDLGTEAVADHPPTRGSRKGPFRILWISSFLHRKAFHLLVEALRGLPGSVDFELRVNGRGPLEGRWRRLTAASGLGHRCRWMHWLTREEVLGQYDWADVLVFTSLRDASGCVTLEAMSRGLPVICLDHQGVADIVTDDCGIKIPVTSPAEVVSRMRDAVISLDGDRARLDGMGAAAIRRAECFLWSRKIAHTAGIYRELTAERATGQ